LDQACAYGRRLEDAGTPSRLTEYRGATHAFLSLPAVVPQAKPARGEVVAFLADHLN
jgi:acetyl esterase